MDPSELRKALRRIYAGAQEAFHAARSTGTPTALHDWRKKSKYLYNAIEVVGERRNAGAPRMAKQTHKLGDWLGEEHDLVVFSSELHSKSGRPRGRINSKLRSIIAERRTKLKKRAMCIGAKTFGDR